MTEIEEEKIWNIYVLKLENEKIFLYTIEENSVSNHDDIVILECKILYDFVKNNKPICVLNILVTNDLLELDLYVKQYMYRYGIENVRGGLYTDEILSTETFNLLNQQLFIKNKHVIENKEIMESIYEKYNIDIINLHVTPEYINTEKQRLLNELEKYKEIENQLKILKSCSIDREILSDLEWIKSNVLGSQYSNKIKENILEENINDLKSNIINEDLEWVTNWIKQNVPEHMNLEESLNKKETNNKYRTIIVKLKALYECYSKNINASITYIPPLYLNRPDIVFDSFFYHVKELRNNMQKFEQFSKDTLHLLAKFEYMAYNLINRIEETSHTLSTYPENYERYINCSCRFLDNCNV